MDEQVQLPRIDVCAKEPVAIWQRVSHSVLLIVWHSLADGTRRGEGFSIRNHPLIQQSRKNCWIVASCVGAHLYQG